MELTDRDRLVSPVNHRTAPNGLTIRGTDADLARAQELVGKHSTVYAALRPTEESKSFCYICCSNFPVGLLLPCFWPHLLIITLSGSCCIFAGIKNYQKDLDHTLYVVTNDMVKVHVEDHNPPCICCTLCTTGSTSDDLLFVNSTIQVNSRGQGCQILQNFCNPNNAVAVLVVVPYGANLNAPRGQRNTGKRLFVHDPAEISRLINDIRAIGSPSQANQANQAKSKRVFVASSTNPTNYQVFTLSDPDSFCRDVSRIFFDNNPSHKSLTFTLADVNIRVTVDQIVENDKISVALGTAFT